MWCPPTRVRKQKKKKSNFALNSVRFRLQENVRLQQCVHTEFDWEVQRRLKSVHIYILHDRHRYKLQSSIIVNRKI